MRYSFFLFLLLLVPHTAFAEVCPKIPCKMGDFGALFRQENYTPEDVEEIKHHVRQHEFIVREYKYSLGQHIRTLKDLERVQKRRLRLQAKCEKVKHQIDQLYLQQKRGYTVKQGQAIERKLAELKFKKRQCCDKGKDIH